MSGPSPQEIWQRVAAWLGHAEEDARIARGCLQLTPPARSGAAFHCQQATEKLLKGFLLRDNIDFGRTHDLERLGTTVVADFQR
jgi:HEPN domain-containing protein